MRSNYDSVPRWVRSLICIIGCSTLIVLLLISAIGHTVPTMLVLGATFFAVWTASLAFRIDIAALQAVTDLFRRWLN